MMQRTKAGDAGTGAHAPAQTMCGPPGNHHAGRPKITTFLWFDDRTEEAIAHDPSLFGDSPRVSNEARNGAPPVMGMTKTVVAALERAATG